MKKQIIILARPDSSRLPNKHNRLIGDKTVIQHIISQLEDVTDNIIVATTQPDYITPSVYFDIDDNDVVERVKRAYDGSDIVITVLGDSVLQDAVLLNNLADLLYNTNKDYIKFGYVNGAVANTSRCGFEVIKGSAISKLESNEHLSLSFGKLNPLIYQMSNELYKFRASIDNFADLAFIRECHRLLGDVAMNYNTVYELLTQNPYPILINSHVKQKSIEFVDLGINVGFLTMGDDKVGLGHLARCIGMAQKLNEEEHRHIHFYVNDNPEVIKMLNEYGYEHTLDYSFGVPVIESDKFRNWDFIWDYPNFTNVDFDSLYRKNPVYGTNLRLAYIDNIIRKDYVISFGKGANYKYGETIFNAIKSNSKILLKDCDNIYNYLKGAKNIITMWSQTAREAIALGKVPIVYSKGDDSKICKYLDSKGYIKWKGDINETDISNW
jgi:spore coat polysaccharide biosynthesis protein SpsF (cytidylyltransferase family)